jgi:hypothetical protein
VRDRKKNRQTDIGRRLRKEKKELHILITVRDRKETDRQT